jgi:hypothetical protein
MEQFGEIIREHIQERIIDIAECICIAVVNSLEVVNMLAGSEVLPIHDDLCRANVIKISINGENIDENTFQYSAGEYYRSNASGLRYDIVSIPLHSVDRLPTNADILIFGISAYDPVSLYIYAQELHEHTILAITNEFTHRTAFALYTKLHCIDDTVDLVVLNPIDIGSYQDFLDGLKQFVDEYTTIDIGYTDHDSYLNVDYTTSSDNKLLYIKWDRHEDYLLSNQIPMFYAFFGYSPSDYEHGHASGIVLSRKDYLYVFGSLDANVRRLSRDPRSHHFSKKTQLPLYLLAYVHDRTWVNELEEIRESMRPMAEVLANMIIRDNIYHNIALYKLSVCRANLAVSDFIHTEYSTRILTESILDNSDMYLSSTSYPLVASFLRSLIGPLSREDVPELIRCIEQETSMHSCLVRFKRTYKELTSIYDGIVSSRI